MAATRTGGDSLWVNGVSVADARMNLAALLTVDSTDPTNVRTGVLWTDVTNGLVRATATTSPSMTVTVDRFHFVAKKANSEGPYLGYSGFATLDIAAAPASGKRIDVVYIMQRDTDSATAPDGSTTIELGVVTGVAAASPTKPAIPAGAIEVGTVTVPAGATSTSSSGVVCATTCQWTALKGTPIPVRNTTERDAMVKTDARMVYRLDTGALEVYNGSSWVVLRAPVAGSFHTPDVLLVDSFQSWTVDFPAGAFSSAPSSVQATASTSRVVMSVRNITSAGFTVEAYNCSGNNTSTTGYDVYWEAVE